MDGRLGNRFWEARSSHGAKPKFKTGKALWSACCEYFEWVEDNPLWETKVTQYQGQTISMDAPKMRAMTIYGLCSYIDIDYTTWARWKSERKDLSNIITRAESIIREQKFTGAAAELLNPNIIARDLGLMEKTQVENVTPPEIVYEVPEDADKTDTSAT